LQQVLSLRQLGFALDEVRGCLDRPGFSPLEVIELHLVRLREQTESHRRLCERLNKGMALAGTGLVGTAGGGVLASRGFGQDAGRAGATLGRSSFASFDGTTIAYSDEGDGQAVILLHGFGVDGLDSFGPFDRLLPKLERTNALLRERFGAAPPLLAPPAEGRPCLAARLREAGARVIVPDMRGFGASDKPQDTRAYADSS
jgi:DNA-binding transcriptional MerR regulator